jgi:hypothetical protein
VNESANALRRCGPRLGSVKRLDFGTEPPSPRCYDRLGSNAGQAEPNRTSRNPGSRSRTRPPEKPSRVPLPESHEEPSPLVAGTVAPGAEQAWSCPHGRPLGAELPALVTARLLIRAGDLERASAATYRIALAANLEGRELPVVAQLHGVQIVIAASPQVRAGRGVELGNQLARSQGTRIVARAAGALRVGAAFRCSIARLRLSASSVRLPVLLACSSASNIRRTTRRTSGGRSAL